MTFKLRGPLLTATAVSYIPLPGVGTLIGGTSPQMIDRPSA